jgi:hypothetical protein
MADLRIFRSGQFRNYRNCNSPKSVLNSKSEVPETTHQVVLLYITRRMIQSNLNNFGEEKIKKDTAR